MADGLSLVHVYFVELEGRELAFESLEDRADDLARATPGCPEVDNYDLVLANLKIVNMLG